MKDIHVVTCYSVKDIPFFLLSYMVGWFSRDRYFAAHWKLLFCHFSCDTSAWIKGGESESGTSSMLFRQSKELHQWFFISFIPLFSLEYLSIYSIVHLVKYIHVFFWQYINKWELQCQLKKPIGNVGKRWGHFLRFNRLVDTNKLSLFFRNSISFLFLQTSNRWKLFWVETSVWESELIRIPSLGDFEQVLSWWHHHH